jgi:predicted HTH transcriptional regulator
MKKQHPIKKLIEQGEGLHLDFKFEVSDAAKIARSLVAFANTDGGKLLIGVKDNGVVRGIQSEEEYYMIENAAERYCKPKIEFTSKEWNVNGKKVLEITIAASDKSPHRAPDKDGKYKAFLRYNDENILAPGVQMKIWQKQNSNDNISVTIEGANKELLDILNETPFITIEQFQQIAGLPKYTAEDILSDFVVLGIIEMKIVDKKILFSLV